MNNNENLVCRVGYRLRPARLEFILNFAEKAQFFKHSSNNLVGLLVNERKAISKGGSRHKN